MNTQVKDNLPQTAEIPTYELVQARDMLFDTAKFAQLERFAQIMASGAATVPSHLAGNVGDCMAVTMQAMQWGMNPFAVAQKTHIVAKGGTLGYEAQLVNAVINSIAPIQSRLEYEFFGDWSKILGKVKEMKGDRGKYYVSDWNPSDEIGLGVIVKGQLKGESKPREITVLLVQCWPRFSTQWATDPQQQITYAATKKWARRYVPDVMLGVYTEDELQEMDNPHASYTIDAQRETVESVSLPPYPDDKFKNTLNNYTKMIADGVKTADDIINQLSLKYTLTQEQKDAYTGYELDLQAQSEE